MPKHCCNVEDKIKKNLVFVFSLNPVIVPFLDEIKHKLGDDKVNFVITSYNNIPFPRPSFYNELITPLELLGGDGISWSFRTSLAWQGSIPSLQSGETNVAKDFVIDGGKPSTYLNWSFRFTPFMHSRMLVVDTAIKSLKELKPKNIFLFGVGETVPWHRDLIIDCIKYYLPGITILDCSQLLAEKSRIIYDNYCKATKKQHTNLKSLRE